MPKPTSFLRHPRPRHRAHPVWYRSSLLRHHSTVTATLAGQIVMEGFLDIKLPPWLRRLITRAIAIIPAAAVTIWYGDGGTAKLLILTQVVLSLQLSFAVFPLLMFTADKTKMGELVAPRWLMAFAVLIGVVIALLNVKLLYDFVEPHL